MSATDTTAVGTEELSVRQIAKQYLGKEPPLSVREDIYLSQGADPLERTLREQLEWIKARVGIIRYVSSGIAAPEGVPVGDDKNDGQSPDTPGKHWKAPWRISGALGMPTGTTIPSP